MWKGANSNPIKRPNALQTFPAQDTHQQLRLFFFGINGHVTACKCLFPQYLQVLLTKTLKNRYFRRISTLSLDFMYVIFGPAHYSRALVNLGWFNSRLVPYPKTVSLRVGCILAKFHGFIIKVNNSYVFGR